MASRRSGVKGGLGPHTKRSHRARRVRRTRSGPVNWPDTQERDTRRLELGLLKAPGTWWKLPQSEPKPGRDQISAEDSIPEKIYQDKLNKTMGEVLRYFLGYILRYIGFTDVYSAF